MRRVPNYVHSIQPLRSKMNDFERFGCKQKECWWQRWKRCWQKRWQQHLSQSTPPPAHFVVFWMLLLLLHVQDVVPLLKIIQLQWRKWRLIRNNQSTPVGFKISEKKKRVQQFTMKKFICKRFDHIYIKYFHGRRVQKK